MKKTVFLISLCLLLISVHNVVAQAELAFGVKAGANFATINADEAPGESFTSKAGLHGGIFASIKFGKFGIQPEVIFSQQGFSSTYELGGETKNHFNYLNVPVILKLYTIKGINFQAGPQFGFLTSAKSKTDGDELDVKSQLKGSDIGIAVGAGWDSPFGLTIDARYNIGLSEVNGENISTAIKNQVIQLSLGYKIKIGK